MACDHFIDEAAKAPPVDTFVVALPVDDFGCQILGSSTNRFSHFVVFDDFRKSEVCEFDISLLVEQDVFRLEAE